MYIYTYIHFSLYIPVSLSLYLYTSIDIYYNINFLLEKYATQGNSSLAHHHRPSRPWCYIPDSASPDGGACLFKPLPLPTYGHFPSLPLCVPRLGCPQR